MHRSIGNPGCWDTKLMNPMSYPIKAPLDFEILDALPYFLQDYYFYLEIAVVITK